MIHLVAECVFGASIDSGIGIGGRQHMQMQFHQTITPIHRSVAHRHYHALVGYQVEIMRSIVRPLADSVVKQGVLRRIND